MLLCTPSLSSLSNAAVDPVALVVFGPMMRKSH